MNKILDLALKQEAITCGVAINHISDERKAEIQTAIEGKSKDYSGITTAEAVRHLGYANWITGLTDDDILLRINATAEQISKNEREKKLVGYKNLVAKHVEATAAKAVDTGIVKPEDMDDFKKQTRSIVESVVIGDKIYIPELPTAAKDLINRVVEEAKKDIALDKELHEVENKKHLAVSAAEEESILKEINKNIGIITVKVHEIKVLKRKLISPKNQDEVDNQLRAALKNFFVEE